MRNSSEMDHEEIIVFFVLHKLNFVLNNSVNWGIELDREQKSQCVHYNYVGTGCRVCAVFGGL